MRMHIDSTTLPLHRTAVRASVDIVNAVKLDDLRNPTPCAGWTLQDLLAHMTAQHHGFGAAARGHGADLAVWDPAAVAGAIAADPGSAYAASADDVLYAFEADGVLDATFALPEFGPGATFPGAMAIAFHFVDYVVHGWDVARAIGTTFELPDEVVAAVLPLALAVPDGEIRATDGAPFGPAVTSEAAASDLDRIVAHLGRSPGWTAKESAGGIVD
jgi:uncharacterized protein (TIGR03086 family)